MDKSLDVSVVIAVYNSATTLQSCLAALSNCRPAPIECLVVDDASDDDSPGIAMRHGARVIRMSQRRGPARARNLGALDARGDVILFLDADVCIHHAAIPRIVDHFRQEPALDAVIGAYDDAPAAPSFLSQYRNLLHCFTHRAGRREASTFWTGLGAIRKEIFLRYGGFDERYERPSIEDIEFGARLKAAGGCIRLDPAIQGKHLKRWTFRGTLKTDIFDRGIPWTRLMLESGSIPNDLAVRWSQRLGVLLAFLLAGALVSRAGRIALACVLALVAVDAPWYAFLVRQRGVLFALRAAPLHVLYHFYSGVAFILGAGLHIVSLVRPSASQAHREDAS
jgi:GT2 family glycosyltransferase